MNRPNVKVTLEKSGVKVHLNRTQQKYLREAHLLCSQLAGLSTEDGIEKFAASALGKVVEAYCDEEPESVEAGK